MNQKQRAQWELTRTGGFLRYVLLYWVLMWGGVMIAFSLITDYFFSHRGLTLVEFEIRVPIILISGFIGGSAVWLIAERRYRSGPQPHDSGR